MVEAVEHFSASRVAWSGVCLVRALKVLDVSPVVELVAGTVYWVDSHWFVPVLGTAEILIGLGLAFGRPSAWFCWDWWVRWWGLFSFS